jgi:undecaprenyl-diphosphatase
MLTITEILTPLFTFLNSFTGIHKASGAELILYANSLSIALVLAVIVFVLIKEQKNNNALKVIMRIFIPVFIAYIYTEVLKGLYAAPRPWEVLENVQLLFQHGGADSFPSGHATAYGAFATSVYLYSKRIGCVVGALFLLLIAFRVIAGIHWPLDIAIGLFVGFLVSYTYHFFVLKRKRVEEKSLHTNSL